MRRLSEHQLANDLFFRACPAGVHSVDPAKLIAGFEDFGDAFGFGELGGNKLNLFISVAVDFDEVLRQSVLHQHQRECIGLMLLQELLPHPSEAADVLGRLGRESKVGIVIVSVLGVSDVHNYILHLVSKDMIADRVHFDECANQIFKDMRANSVNPL